MKNEIDLKNYDEITEYSGHYIQQHIKDKHFVVFGMVEDGYIIDLTFSKNRKILHTANSLQEIINKIEKSGVCEKPRRH